MQELGEGRGHVNIRGAEDSKVGRVAAMAENPPFLGVDEVDEGGLKEAFDVQGAWSFLAPTICRQSSARLDT